MNNLFKLICLFVLAGNVFSIERPAWLDDPAAECSKKSICAIGEAATREAAVVNAHVAISKIFDNQIYSKFSSVTDSENSKLSDSANEEIKQITESSIQGIEAKKYYSDKGVVYVLVSLSKSKIGRKLKKDIDAIDEKMVALYSNKSSSSLIQLEDIYLKRAAIESRYQFVTGIDLPAPISYQDIYTSKKNATKNIVIHLFLDETDPKIIEQFLASEFTHAGYKVTRGKSINSSATHFAKGEVKVVKQMLQVKGFEKYLFHVKISLTNIKNIGAGEFEYSISETGRNLDQVEEKIIPKIKQEIKDKIIEFKFE